MPRCFLVDMVFSDKNAMG